MKARFQSSLAPLLAPLSTKLSAWWSAITPREQRLVMVCAGLVMAGGLYWGIVEPLTTRAEQAELRLQSEKQLLGWVEDQAETIASLRAAGGRSVSTLALNQAVSSTAKRFNVELVRVQPRGEELQVWISPMPFNQFVSWIAFLQETHGVHVTALDLDRGKQEGVVDVRRLQLVKG